MTFRSLVVDDISISYTLSNSWNPKTKSFFLKFLQRRRCGSLAQNDANFALQKLLPTNGQLVGITVIPARLHTRLNPIQRAPFILDVL